MSPFVKYPVHLIAIWTVLLLAALPIRAEGIFTIGTGSVVGLYYKTAAEICRNFNETKEAHQPKCHTLTTGGSLDNLEALKRKEIDIAIVQADLVEEAISATGSFAGRSPFSSLKGLLALHLEPMTVVATANNDIDSFEDLLAKRLDIANPGSGTRASFSAFMEANDLEYHDFSLVTEFKATEQDKNLCRGRIEAFTFLAGHPNRAIERAAEKCAIKLVPLDDSSIANVIKANPAVYSRMKVSGSDYGLTGAPVNTFGVRAVLVTHEDSDPDLVHRFTSEVLTNLPHLQQWHPAFAELTFGQMSSLGLTLPFHRGAQRSFSDAGLMEAPQSTAKTNLSERQFSQEDLGSIAELASDFIELNDRFPAGFQDYQKQLIKYYRETGSLFWATSAVQREGFTQVLYSVVSDGLNPADYPVQALTELSRTISQTDDLVSLARAEAIYSTVFAFYASDLKIGRFKPREVDPELFTQTKRLNVGNTLTKLSEASSLSQFVAGFRSSNPEYRALRSLLSKHQTILVQGGWPQVPTGRVLKENMEGDDVAVLRQRLTASKDITIPSRTPALFDPGLKMAVKRFQDRHCQRRSKNPPLAGVKMYQFDGVGQSSLSAFSGAAVGCGAGRG